MKSLYETLFGRLLGRLSDIVVRYRWLFFLPQIALFGLCVVYTRYHLQIDPSRDNLVGADKPYHRDYMNYKREFPAQDDLVVVVDIENSEEKPQAVSPLAGRHEG